MRDWIVFLCINAVIPTTGILFYVLLVRKMKREKTPEAPIGHFFWVFALYGALIILILTSFIGKWSGMASLLALFPIVAGPIISGIIALTVYKQRKYTKYHNLIFWLSAGYIGVLLLSIWLPGILD